MLHKEALHEFEPGARILQFHQLLPGAQRDRDELAQSIAHPDAGLETVRWLERHGAHQIGCFATVLLRMTADVNEDPLQQVGTGLVLLGQRQVIVGRDTPSFEQALLDALREDPDVLMVGEMRHPETMRLTLSASETGHLVLATLHSSTCAEALQRVVSAFPAEIQSGVAAQLADCLVAVI